MIESQIARMITMAQEILEYSQGRSQLNKERVSLRDLFEETEKLNAAYMEKNCIDYVFDPVDAVVEIDRTRITRVLQNLLSNAVEAMNGRGGRIVFRALLPAPGMVELRIEDNGPGIPENIRAKLCEPFVTSGKRQGTGRGMAIAKSIVEGHGGTIGFTTETGSGTVFAIRLPTA
jgi:signal transduction histidine kinase